MEGGTEAPRPREVETQGQKEKLLLIKLGVDLSRSLSVKEGTSILWVDCVGGCGDWTSPFPQVPSCS